MRRPVVWEKLRAGGNFWSIISYQKQPKYSISDRIGPPQDIANECKRVDYPALSSH